MAVWLYGCVTYTEDYTLAYSVYAMGCNQRCALRNHMTIQPYNKHHIFVLMNRTKLGKFAAIAALFASGLLFVQFSRSMPAQTSVHTPLFSERVNLALRRTGHYLLKESGDSTSRIAPIQHPDANTWLLMLERPFDYDRIPALLEESLRQNDVHDPYYVAVVNCDNGELQLGYNQVDFEKTKEVACGGRESELRCANLQITFADADASAQSSTPWYLLTAGFLLAGMAYAIWRWNARGPSVHPENSPVTTERADIQLGNSSLDVANQTFFSGGRQHKLTYRETKLLHLFVIHPNQLLEREFILKSVWEDEGIIVGRSVDVFVSRLRKMFREDAALKLVAVHGVGYRLEVA